MSFKSMMSAVTTLLLILIIGAFYFLMGGEALTGVPAASGSDLELKEALSDGQLKYTKHARCRMECRTISESEIRAVLATGKVNHRKSKPADSPCPSYALEGRTNDGQRVRIVYADCGNITRVVTAIDLDNEYECHCK